MPRPRIGVIVITVAAVVATAVLVLGVWALPRLRAAGIPSEKVVLGTIRTATLAWQSEHPRDCPTLEQLISDRWLDAEFCRFERWCHCRYTIECTDDEIRVTCADHPARTETSGVAAPSARSRDPAQRAAAPDH
jgi:hypothetical protein